jgi:hypothetical protein
MTAGVVSGAVMADDSARLRIRYMGAEVIPEVSFQI